MYLAAGLEGPSLEFSQVCMQLLGGTLGRLTEGVTVTFSVLTLVGAQVVYWVLMSNFLFNTGEIIYGKLSLHLFGTPTGFPGFKLFCFKQIQS